MTTCHNPLLSHALLQVLDATADGYARGEACRAMWIEAADDLSAAQPDPATSKQPLGIIAGTSVNTNGRASSLTAPHGPSQQELIAVALAAGGMAATDVTGIVLHANGTSLGEWGGGCLLVCLSIFVICCI
jgi:acyl transferase domain-containing protein